MKKVKKLPILKLPDKNYNFKTNQPILCLAYIVFYLLSISLSGIDVVTTVKYQKKLYGQSGFGGSILFPLRYAKTEILKCQQPANNCQVVSTVETDLSGLIDVTVASLNIGDFISIRFYAKNCPECAIHRKLGEINADFSIEVKNFSDALFTYTVDFLDPINTALFEKDITIPFSVSGPFNIFTILGAGFEFLYESSATFTTNALPTVAPFLTVRWELLSTVGTFFQCNFVNGKCTGNSMIFILGSQSDPDEFDDDVILHEFGHYVESNFGRSDSIGGPHSPTSALDLRLSWSEGYADFFSSWCREWLRETNSFITPEFGSLYTTPHLYIDNKAIGADVLNFEINTLGQGTDYEVSVASILWDIWDNNNEQNDTQSVKLNTDGYDELFELFLIFMPDKLSNTPADQTIERFYDNFLIINGSGTCDIPSIGTQPMEVCLQVIFEQNNSPSYVGDFTEADRKGNVSLDLGAGEGPFDLTRDPQLPNTELDLTRKTVTVEGLTFYAGEPTDPPSDPMYSVVFTFNCNNPANPDDIFHKCDWEIFRVHLEQGVKYVFETVNLKDGADTVIEVWSTPPDLTELRACGPPFCLAENDDIDPSEGVTDERDKKRSKLVFTSPSSGDFYILVHSYDKQDAISTYGGYDFKAGPFQPPPQLPSPQLTGGGGGGGCFIATAVSNNDKNILNPLRKYRDTVLQNTFIGNKIVKAYYKLAPPIAQEISKSRTLKNAIYNLIKSFVKDNLSDKK